MEMGVHPKAPLGLTLPVPTEETVSGPSTPGSQIFWDSTVDISDLCPIISETEYELDDSIYILNSDTSREASTSVSRTPSITSTTTLYDPLPLSFKRKTASFEGLHVLERRTRLKVESAKDLSLTAEVDHHDPKQPETISELLSDLIGDRTSSTLSVIPKPVHVHPEHHIPHGVVIIAHQDRLQNFFNARQLNWAVQWEIARFFTLGRLQYENISIPKLDELKGTNAQIAARVAKILLLAEADDQGQAFYEKSFAREMSSKSPWKELSDEEDRLRNRTNLGCVDDSYGGKVQFTGKVLHDKADKSKFRIELDAPAIGPSNRFARRFGSRRFIRLRISKTLLHATGDTLEKYFSLPFVIHGSVFRAFFAKENNVFLIETPEKFAWNRIEPRDQQWINQNGILPLHEFLDWHNPMEYNKTQTVAKWAARFALGLSNSVPGFKLEPSNVITIPDIISHAFDGNGKPPSEMEMTDGCGWASAPLLQTLRQKYTWETFPIAVQCRIGGAKGLIALHPDGMNDGITANHKIWIRPSQTKIKYSSDKLQDEANYIVDVLEASRMRYPSRLSPETIICLAENGVDHHVFAQLMTEGLDSLVDGLTNWDGEMAMARLWYNVARVGAVMSSRRARELRGESRSRGFGDRADDDSDDEDEDPDAIQIDPAVQQKSTAWWADQISGCPSSLEETVMVLLDSGFTPRDCPVLAEKLKHVILRAIKSYVLRYKIVVPLSCIAFIIPDPFGVLDEGDIHIMSSRTFKSQDGLDTNVILGEVIVTRYPCKLPTDCRKVNAVYKKELRHYMDVIVFSVKGSRSLASMLGGGDYDGDKVIAIWQPEIVTRFRNADTSFSEPPPQLTNSFTRNNETVAEFLDRVPSIPERRVQEAQKFLLGALRGASVKGQYSLMHDIATYKLGYGHPETLYLAHMFCTCLDGAKTGLIVLPEVLKRDREKYLGRAPAWKETAEEAERQHNSGSNLVNPSRQVPYQFIMDAIKQRGRTEGDNHANEYQKRIASTQVTLDEHLVAPWQNAERRAQQISEKVLDNHIMQEELEAIKTHVRDLRAEHRKLVAPQHNGTTFTSKKIEDRQDHLRSLSKKFHEKPEGLLYFTVEARRLKASYAYIHDSEEMKSSSKEKWTRFPWDVAMRELCTIKAEALGPTKTLCSSMYELMTIHPSVTR